MAKASQASILFVPQLVSRPKCKHFEMFEGFTSEKCILLAAQHLLWVNSMLLGLPDSHSITAIMIHSLLILFGNGAQYEAFYCFAHFSKDDAGPAPPDLFIVDYVGVAPLPPCLTHNCGVSIGRSFGSKIVFKSRKAVMKPSLSSQTQ